MAGQTIAAAYVAILPSFSGGAAAIGREMDGPLGQAGTAGGTKYGGGMRTSIAGMAKSIFAPLLAIGATVMVGKFFSGAITEASGLNESINALNVSYGDASEGVQALGKSAATNLGLSNLEFNNLAVRFSSFSKTIAGDGGDVTATLDDLTTRASDFASVMNIDVNEAAQLFQSGLAGESEPLRRYGLDMSAASVEAYGLAHGLAANGTALTESEKIQARYGYLMEQTSNTQGDFANTSDQLANKQRIVAARFADVKARIGTALLPAMSALVGFVGDSLVPMLERAGAFLTDTLIPAIQGFIQGFKDGTGAGGVFRDIIDKVGAVLGAIGGYITGTIVPAIQSFIAEFQNGEGAGGTFRDILEGIGDVIGTVADYITGTIVPAVQSFIQGFRDSEGAGGTFRSVLETIGDVLNWLWTSVISPVASAIGAIFTWLWNSVLSPVINFIVGAIRVWADVIGWLWTNVTSPIFGFIGEIVGWLWSTIISPVVGFIVGAIQVWAAVIGWLWSNIISPIFGFIGDIINWLWTSIVSVVVDFIVGYIHALGAVFTWLWENAISPAFNFISGAFDDVKTAFGLVHDFFSDKVAAIGRIFSGIADTISGAFRGVFNGIANAWNNSVGKLSWSVPGWVPVIGGNTISAPRIPLLASGALVTNPALAVLGESGSEAVLPFSRVDEFAGMLARAMGQMDAGPVSGRGRDLIDYDRLARAMSHVQIGLDGRTVSQSVDQRIGASIR